MNRRIEFRGGREMRKIKFRGKREDNGEWVFGSFIPDALEGSNSDLVSWGFIRRYNRGIGKMETIEVDRETVGQFTGLHDKNGVKIFEGDIVACGDGKVPTEIRWVQESSAFMAYNLKRKEYHLLNKYFERFIGEIIGSIYENPELLEA